jgi:hypothetical protein
MVLGNRLLLKSFVSAIFSGQKETIKVLEILLERKHLYLRTRTNIR